MAESRQHVMAATTLVAPVASVKLVARTQKFRVSRIRRAGLTGKSSLLRGCLALTLYRWLQIRLRVVSETRVHMMARQLYNSSRWVRLGYHRLIEQERRNTHDGNATAVPAATKLQPSL